MPDRIRQLLERIQAFWRRQSQRTRLAVGAVVLLTVAALAALAIYNATRPYAVLFSDLSDDDLASVLNYLNTSGITDYRVSANNTITVPESQEASVRMRVLTENYSGSGTNYELYLGNVNALSSDADRRTLQIYDLQNRLAATIKQFPGVRNAQVFLTIGEDNRYILSSDTTTPATASVVLDMQSGQVLNTQYVTVIRNMVKNAVAGLTFEDITIGDTSGNFYDTADTSADSDAAQLKLRLESRVNKYVKDQIMDMLGRMFGEANVAVTVNSTVDISRSYQESTSYDEPDWAIEAANGQGIIGRRIWGNGIVRDAGTGAGGVVGTSNNADLNEYVIDASQLTGDENSVTSSGEVDYNVPTTRVQTEIPAGTITDISVAVAVNSTNVDVPDTQTLVALVARAAGINVELEGDKIAVVAYPFYDAPPAPALPDEIEFLGVRFPAWTRFALVAGLVLFVLLFLLIWLIRRALAKRRARIQAERERQRIIDEANAMAAAAEAAAAEAAANGDSEAAEAALAAARNALAAAEAAANGDADAAKDALNGARDTLNTTRNALVAAAAEAAASGDMEAAQNALNAFKVRGAAVGAPPIPGFSGEEGELPAEGEEGARQGEEGANIMDLDSEDAMELRMSVRRFAEESPQVAAQIIRLWLRGEEEENA